MEDYNSEEVASGDPCFYYEIPGGLLDKDVIEITGYFYGEKIMIEVLAEKYNHDGENTALPLQFVLTRAGNWTATTYTQSVPHQVKSGTTVGSENFQIRIVALDSSFEIFHNGTQLCTQKHLVPLPQVTHISIDGDAEFTGVEFKDLVSENDASVRSDHLSGTNEYDADPVAPGFTRLSESRRSSNRKPKPPVVVPTHGSFRAKPSLATTREEPDTYMKSGEDLNFIIKTTPATPPVKASADPAFEAAASGVAVSGKGGSNLSFSGKKNSEKKLSLREKILMRRASKSSTKASVGEGHEYVTAGSAEDVWVEEGGPEFSADGAGVFTVAGAASVPNLSSKPDKGKEKKRFTMLHGKKKSHSTSSPPDGEKMDENEKKKHFLGLHFGKGGKKEKEPKLEKESKKFSLGKKSPKIGSTKDISAISAEIAVCENATLNQPNNFDSHTEAGKVTLASIAKQSKPGTSTSLHNVSRNSFIDSHGKGSYNLDLAEKTFDIQHGMYQKTSAEGEVFLSGDVAAGIGGVAVSVDKDHGKKLKGESANIAAQLVEGSAVGTKGSIETFTNYNPSMDIPLHLESPVDKGAVVVSTTAVSSKEENIKKEKRPKLKGASAEIADDILGNNRGMSNEFVTYTGTHVTEPLKLTSEDLLSVNGKGFSPILGSKGSYNLENIPDAPTGVYQPRVDTSWAEELPVIQQSASVDVQHSKPPGFKIEGGAVAITSASSLNKKAKKNLLKGESAEIASNIFDEEGVKVLRKSSTSGYPLCGINGFSMPWKIDTSNRDAQPIPYSIMSPSYSPQLKERHSFGGEYAIAASSGNDVYAAAQLSEGANLYVTKSATMPQSAEFGIGGASTAVILRDKDKKVRQDSDDKDHKHHRISGIFRKMFRRKKKSGASLGEEEYGISEGTGTDLEMSEYRTSSQQSFDFDRGEADFTVTAEPSEVCLFASQLRGKKPALEGNFRMRTMCGGGTFQVPLQMTAADIPGNISAEGAKYVFASTPMRRQRTDSLNSWSTVSPGGSRRIYHRSSKHRPESASSWSSISPGGTRRHRTLVGTLDTRRSITPGGSDHMSLDSVQIQQQIPAYAANERDQLHDTFFTIQKQESAEIHAALPQNQSAHSSNSSIPSLYGRIVLVGQSPGFHTRIQSYRERIETTKKSKLSSGKNGKSGSNSSISSIASDHLPSTVVKARGGEYAIFVDGGKTIFQERPSKMEDIYADNTNFHGSTR